MKKTMTLNLTRQEMDVVETLSTQWDMSKTAVLRKAIRMLQLVEIRLSRGERLFVEDALSKKMAELVLL